MAQPDRYKAQAAKRGDRSAMACPSGITAQRRTTAWRQNQPEERRGPAFGRSGMEIALPRNPL
jgi:hypothetical protein